MSTFEVSGTFRTDVEFNKVVNADSRDEAENMARDLVTEENINVLAIDVDEIKEVK